MSEQENASGATVPYISLLACTVCGQVPNVCETVNIEIHEKGWRVRCGCPRRCASETRDKAVEIWNRANLSE